MLNDARGHLFDAPHMVVFPALAVMTAVLSFNLLGDALARLARSADPLADGRPGVFPLTRSWRMKTQTRDRTMAAHYLVRITGAPRPRLKVRAALALFTAISRYPLEPT